MIFYSLVSADLRAQLAWIDCAPYFVGGSPCPLAWRSDFSIIDSAGVAEIAGASICYN